MTAAVLKRRRTGRGAFIDLSQAEAAAYMIGSSLMSSMALAKDDNPLGNSSPAEAPQGCYPCRGNDRWCVISIEFETQWHALARCLGRPEWLQDPRFNSLASRRQHREELDSLITAWTRDKDSFDVMDLLQRAGVPCGVVQTGKDLVADPHLKSEVSLSSKITPGWGI